MLASNPGRVDLFQPEPDWQPRCKRIRTSCNNEFVVEPWAAFRSVATLEPVRGDGLCAPVGAVRVPEKGNWKQWDARTRSGCVGSCCLMAACTEVSQ